MTFRKSIRGHGRKSAFLLALLCFYALLAICLPVSAIAESPADAVKAAYLLQFPQFVEWPAGSFPNASSPLEIVLLGKRPLGGAADSLRGKTVMGRPVKVRVVQLASEIEPCHIIFVDASIAPDFREGAATLRSRPVLTVSDADGFAAHGGIVGFFTEGNRIRFQINIDAVQRSGLRLSSRLLGLARIVRD